MKLIDYEREIIRIANKGLDILEEAEYKKMDGAILVEAYLSGLKCGAIERIQEMADNLLRKEEV